MLRTGSRQKRRQKAFSGCLMFVQGGIDILKIYIKIYNTAFANCDSH